MKKIELSGKRGAGKYALVDDEDYEWLSQWSWHVGSTGYAMRNVTVQNFSGMRAEGRSTRKSYKVRLHREVMGLSPGDGLQVDHINGDRLDNRRSNLRIVTNAQNRQNEKPVRGGSSAYRGVTWDSARGKWKATSCLDGKRYNLGRFDTEIEAAEIARTWRRENLPFSTR